MNENRFYAHSTGQKTSNTSAMAVQATVASVCFILLCWSSYVCSSHPSASSKAEWPNHGGGLDNRREARNEHKINLNAATRFKTKWKVETGGEVSATPAIANGVLPDMEWRSICRR